MFEPDFLTVKTDEVALNVAVAGDPANIPIICLHGFPEYWAAWREVMEDLSRDHYVVAPDQRGFNLSSKPEGEEAYRASRLVADLAALADHFCPGRQFVLAGHDWGAAVAYAYAFAFPDRLSHLVIANGVHPVCFQWAILQDPRQRRASQYFHKLRAPGAAARMADNGFARTMRMIAGFSRTDWMTTEIAEAYRAAWAQPGAMQAMLHWYSSSPVVVPELEETITDTPLLSADTARVVVRMPHLVIWGEEDQALTSACLEGLEQYASDLTIQRIAGAGHWILHEKPTEIAAAIRSFIR